MLSRPALATMLTAALLFSGVPASAQSAPAHLKKLDRALQQALESGAGSQRVIIRVKAGAVKAVRDRLTKRGDRVTAEHAGNTLSGEVRVANVLAYASDQAIETMSTDALVGANSTLSYESTGSAQALRETLGLTNSALTGAGVVVALIDSGLHAEFDQSNRTIEFRDFTDGGRLLARANDDYGHGSHVGGLIGGPASEQVGIAPATRFVALKVLDAYGRGYTSNVISAIDYAIQNKGRLGIDIINLSLGHRIYEPAATDPLVQAVERATRAGIICVVAAGNAGTNPVTGLTGYAGILSPGNAPSAITVGAVDTKRTASRSDDEIARYSSRGPTWYDAYAKPDIVAPGHALVSNNAIRSELDETHPELRVDSQYLRLNGTSMAAGVTTGVIALMLEAHSDTIVCLPLCGCEAPAPLTPNAVKAFLQYSALPINDNLGAPYHGLVQGAGSLNALGAIALADAVDTSVAAGLPWLTVGVVPYTTIAGETLTWARNIIWGNNVVWGDALVDTNQAAWAANLVWGNLDDNIVWGNSLNMIWGNADDNIVWGNDADNIVWGNNVVWGDSLVGVMDDSDNIVWGNNEGDNIVWGNLDDDNIVWGNLSDDNIVWGNNLVWGNVLTGSGEL